MPDLNDLVPPFLPTVADMVEGPVAYVTKNKKDDSGHEHAADGKFTGHGGSAVQTQGGREASESEGPLKSAKDVYADHTDAKGTTDTDGAVAETMRRGLYPPTQTNSRKAVFIAGGGGSGKGGVVKEHYIGTEHGERDQNKNAVVPGHAKFKAPEPGFEHQIVFDSDREKKKNPLYSNKPGFHPSQKDGESEDPRHAGMYGPSGPSSFEELAKYPKHEQQAVRDHVQQALGMSLEDFAKHPGVAKENAKNAEKGVKSDFGGGLTHEVSSAVTKGNLARALASPDHPSFVYDSVGSEDYKDWMKQAKEAGYDPVFHSVEVPREVAQHRNAKRARSVDTERLAGTHDKAEKVIPSVRSWIHEDGPEGGARYGIEDRKSEPYDHHELEAARYHGFTTRGHSPQLQSVNRDKFRQAFEERNGRRPKDADFPHAESAPRWTPRRDPGGPSIPKASHMPEQKQVKLPPHPWNPSAA